jgi:hypothetical protein
MDKGAKRTHKGHTALAAQERGSPEWKERLRKRALRGVEELRVQLLARARASTGAGSHGGVTSQGTSVTRQQMHSIIECAMDWEDDEDGETFSGDLPPLSDVEYEDLMLAMYEELQRAQG